MILLYPEYSLLYKSAQSPSCFEKSKALSCIHQTRALSLDISVDTMTDRSGPIYVSREDFPEVHHHIQQPIHEHVYHTPPSSQSLSPYTARSGYKTDSSTVHTSQSQVNSGIPQSQPQKVNRYLVIGLIASSIAAIVGIVVGAYFGVQYNKYVPAIHVSVRTTH
jgi:hypothetical protein